MSTEETGLPTTCEYTDVGRQPPEDLVLVVATDDDLDPVPLRGQRINIGRSRDNDVVLGDPYVSSRHCRIEERRSHYAVRDLGSRNGTLVNGARIREGLLSAGTRLTVGSAVLLCLRRGPRPGAFCGPGGLVGRSAPMRRVAATLTRLGPRGVPVLIEGETGTGKELAARAIHELSPRRRGPLVAVNCGALSPELAMSELFGHERGAFTGAAKQHRGAFEQAGGGTLFLDEVGELDPRVQAALLRVLETSRVRRVGGSAEVDVDARVVAATNRRVERAVANGQFRLDLLHRLAVLRLHMPSLRERIDDVPDLVDALLLRSGSHHVLTADAYELLATHSWPGNVRELKNVLERSIAMARGQRVHAREIRIDGGVAAGGGTELVTLLAVVDEHGGSVAGAARALGMPRTTLRDKIERARLAS